MSVNNISFLNIPSNTYKLIWNFDDPILIAYIIACIGNLVTIKTGKINH